MRGKVSRKTIFGFIGPAVIGLAAVGIAPLLYALWTSLHFYNLTKLRRVEFIGLENYWTVLTDEVFWQAMGRTFFLLGTALPLQIALGLGIAVIVVLTITVPVNNMIYNYLLSDGALAWAGLPDMDLMLKEFYSIRGLDEDGRPKENILRE